MTSLGRILLIACAGLLLAAASARADEEEEDPDQEAAAEAPAQREPSQKEKRKESPKFDPDDPGSLTALQDTLRDPKSGKALRGEGLKLGADSFAGKTGAGSVMVKAIGADGPDARLVGVILDFHGDGPANYPGGALKEEVESLGRKLGADQYMLVVSPVAKDYSWGGARGDAAGKGYLDMARSLSASAGNPEAGLIILGLSGGGKPLNDIAGYLAGGSPQAQAAAKNIVRLIDAEALASYSDRGQEANVRKMFELYPNIKGDFYHGTDSGRFAYMQRYQDRLAKEHGGSFKFGEELELGDRFRFKPAASHFDTMRQGFRHALDGLGPEAWDKLAQSHVPSAPPSVVHFPRAAQLADAFDGSRAPDFLRFGGPGLRDAPAGGAAALPAPPRGPVPDFSAPRGLSAPVAEAQRQPSLDPLKTPDYFGALKRFDTQGLLTLKAGKDREFGEAQRKLYEKLKDDPRVQFAVRNLTTGEVLAASKNAGENWYGASVPKAVVAAAFLNKMAEQGLAPTPEQYQAVFKLLVNSDNGVWSDVQRWAGGAGAVKAFSDKITSADGSPDMRPARNDGNSVNSLGLLAFEKAVANHEFAGADALDKVMHAVNTGEDKGRKYMPKDMVLAGKTGTYGDANHDMRYFKGPDGDLYGISVLTKTGRSEPVAAMVGGLYRDFVAAQAAGPSPGFDGSAARQPAPPQQAAIPAEAPAFLAARPAPPAGLSGRTGLDAPGSVPTPEVPPRAPASKLGESFDAAAAALAKRYGASQAVVRLVAETAQKHGVPVDLALAVAANESRFRQGAESPVGALGVMQLMPGTAEFLGVDPYALEQNVEGGVRYLAMMLKKFDGDRALAAAGYNAGPGAVQKYGGIPPYRETQNYVEKVLGTTESLARWANALISPATLPDALGKTIASLLPGGSAARRADGVAFPSPVTPPASAPAPVGTALARRHGASAPSWEMLPPEDMAAQFDGSALKAAAGQAPAVRKEAPVAPAPKSRRPPPEDDPALSDEEEDPAPGREQGVPEPEPYRPPQMYWEDAHLVYWRYYR